MTIKVSVIVPAKNRIKYTRQALESIFDQKLHANHILEVILVDDRSDPPLDKLLKKEFNKVIYYRNVGRKGPGSSRNVGIKKATGDFIAFLDNDDQWKSNFLQTSLSDLSDSDSAATVCLTQPYFYGDFPIIQKTKLILLNIIRMTFLSLFWVFNKKQLPKSGFYLCQISHMVFNMKYVKKLKFNETAAAAEDWEYNVSATSKKSIRIIPKRLVNFRYEMGSNTFTPIVREKKEKAYYELLNKLPKSHSRGILNFLFRQYIKYFLVK